MTKPHSSITDTQRLDFILKLIQEGGTDRIADTIDWTSSDSSLNRDYIDYAIREKIEKERYNLENEMMRLRAQGFKCYQDADKIEKQLGYNPAQKSL